MPRLGGRVAPRSLRLRRLVAVLLTLTVSTAGLAVGPRPDGSTHAAPALTTSSISERALAAARASWNLGQGPATAGGLAHALGALVASPQRTAGPLVNSSSPSWLNLTGAVGVGPATLVAPAMVYDAADGYVVLVNGQMPNTPVYVYPTFTWIFKDGAWSKLNISGPPGRVVPSVAYDAADGEVVLFGGAANGSSFGDTWTYAHGVWTQVNSSTSPGPRWFSSMAYDSTDRCVLMYGGVEQQTQFRYHDFWKFSRGNWTQLPLNASASPPALQGAALADDPADHEVVLFGGQTPLRGSITTWTYAGGNWTRLYPVPSPPTRTQAAFAYDPDLSAVVLAGGYNTSTSSALNDTWSFHGGAWTNLTVANAPPATTRPGAMTWDPPDGFLLDSTEVNWELGPAFVGWLTVAPPIIDLGSTVGIRTTVAPEGASETFAYSGLPPGCATENATVLSCTATAAGTFSIAVAVSAPGNQSLALNATLSVNAAPTLTEFGATPAELTLGVSTNLSLSVIGGTPPWKYSYSGLPPGCTTASTPNLHCRPTASGNYTVSATVTDSLSGVASASTNLTVYKVPQVLRLTASATQLDLGQNVTIVATSAGGTPPLSYAYSGLPPGCSSVDAGVLSCTPTGTGVFSIVLLVTDAVGVQASSSLVITVNPDPQIGAFTISPAAVDVGQTIGLSWSLTGGSGVASIVYSGLPSGCVGGNVTSFACTPHSAGIYSVEVTLTDVANVSTTASAELTVSPPLVVEGLTAARATVDVSRAETLTVAVVGGTSPFLYAYSGLPPGCSGTNGPSIGCAPTQRGSFTVRVQVTDAVGASGGASADIVVVPLPTIVSFTASPSTLLVGANVTFSSSVTGGSGGTSFSYTSLPAGCRSSNSSELTCSPTAAGDSNVSLVVTDEEGANATSNVTVTVLPLASGGSPPSASSSVEVEVALLGLLAVGVASAVLLRRRRRGPTGEPEEGRNETSEESSPEMNESASSSDALGRS